MSTANKKMDSIARYAIYLGVLSILLWLGFFIFPRSTWLPLIIVATATLGIVLVIVGAIRGVHKKLQAVAKSADQPQSSQKISKSLVMYLPLLIGIFQIAIIGLYIFAVTSDSFQKNFYRFETTCRFFSDSRLCANACEYVGQNSELEKMCEESAGNVWKKIEIAVD
jgi:hypothetical protein